MPDQGDPIVRIPSGAGFVLGGSCSDPSGYLDGWVELEGDADLRVNGASPKVFTFTPPQDMELVEIRFGMTTDEFKLDGTHFGRHDVLANGVKLEVSANGNLGTMVTFRRSEDMAIKTSPSAWQLINTGPRDLVIAGFIIGRAITLQPAAGDFVRVTIQDDLRGNHLHFFQCYVKGTKL